MWLLYLFVRYDSLLRHSLVSQMSASAPLPQYREEAVGQNESGDHRGQVEEVVDKGVTGAF